MYTAALCNSVYYFCRILCCCCYGIDSHDRLFLHSALWNYADACFSVLAGEHPALVAPPRFRATQSTELPHVTRPNARPARLTAAAVVAGETSASSPCLVLDAGKARAPLSSASSRQSGIVVRAHNTMRGPEKLSVLRTLLEHLLFSGIAFIVTLLVSE